MGVNDPLRVKVMDMKKSVSLVWTLGLGSTNVRNGRVVSEGPRSCTVTGLELTVWLDLAEQELVAIPLLQSPNC